MLILDFEEFATLCPPGTLFSFLDPSSPDYRRGLFRKVETLRYDEKPSDFTYMDLLPQDDHGFDLYNYHPDSYSIQLEDCDIHRWGEYDYDIKYIVFQEEDIAILKAGIEQCVPCK